MRYALFLVGLAACATTPGAGGPGGGERAPRRLLAETEAPDPGVLEDFDVPAGRCGMTLWTKSGADQVPVFRSVDDGTASMVIDGQPVALSLTGRGGETRVGIPATQAFEGRAGDRPITVTMRGAWGQPFPAGSYVARAAITVRGEDGWSRVVPAAGIAGCRP